MTDRGDAAPLGIGSAAERFVRRRNDGRQERGRLRTPCPSNPFVPGIGGEAFIVPRYLLPKIRRRAACYAEPFAPWTLSLFA